MGSEILIAFGQFYLALLPPRNPATYLGRREIVHGNGGEFAVERMYRAPVDRFLWQRGLES